MMVYVCRFYALPVKEKIDRYSLNFSIEIAEMCKSFLFYQFFTKEKHITKAS